MEVQNPKTQETLRPTPKTLETVTAPTKPAADDGSKQDPAVAKAASLPSPTAALAEAAAVAEAVGAETDLQKKLRRAERFGMAVQLSEEEKRNSRAERFGTAPTSHGKSEEAKRKARAERFGTAAGHSTSDEEAKKKARLARFGTDAKVTSVEEEKMKARAIRFSQTSTGAPAGTNGKAEHGQKEDDTKT